MINAADQRTSKRIATERPVKLYIDDQVFPGKMLDLSTLGAGAFIKAKSLPDKKEGVLLEFSLSTTGAPLRLKGNIIHQMTIRGSFLVGIQFTENHHQVISQINQFIRSK